ncbi:MAG TPA: tRNA epoxyqueuosine(34) reductase QueG [Gammaproteobacteria bacterium]|nr:tRNA epoxyqueuosine(34) reductase QueG [Gammaproteobacteria bacterium]
MRAELTSERLAELAVQIKSWGQALGFRKLGIARTDTGEAAARLRAWLAAGMHGEMHYMARDLERRTQPEVFLPGTRSVIVARLDCLPPEGRDPRALLDDGEHAYIARYALGRDYHKVIRRRLQKLADRIVSEIGPFGYRAFADSAAVLEKPLAASAGLGWMGKHTLLIDPDTGSFFLLGELYTDLALPADEPVADRCGSCRACLKVCPTGAIVAPYTLDARRCISYLTIELHGPIPVELRRAIGNRVFGCDDCQLFCPWNRYARATHDAAFTPRHGLDDARLVELFAWSEEEFLRRTEGSALRRLNHERWLRNLAVALGNARTTPEVIAALQSRLHHPSPLVREHVEWALEQHRGKALAAGH